MTRPVVELPVEFSYEAAHWLPKVRADHKCRAMHGHSYHLTVIVRGVIRDDGMVEDFDWIKQQIGPVIQQLDHRCLNDIIDNPTVENQLVWLWEHLQTVPLCELRLRETDKHSGIYRGEKA